MALGYLYVSSLGAILHDIVPDEPLASIGGYTLNNSLHIINNYPASYTICVASLQNSPLVGILESGVIRD